jgi:hypothetical protein
MMFPFDSRIEGEITPQLSRAINGHYKIMCGVAIFAIGLIVYKFFTDIAIPFIHSVLVVHP